MALTKVQNTGIADDAITTDKIENTTVVAADIAPGTIANAKLANSSITLNGSSISLGGSGSLKHIDWQALTVADGSTQVTASPGKGYFLDTNAGVIEVVLSSSPSRGDTYVFADYGGTFATNQLIINTGGQLIDSTTGPDFKVTTNNAVVELVYVDANKGYLVKLNQAAGSTPGSVLTGGVYDRDASFISATGGTVATSGDFKIHIFTGDGCFVVSSLGGGSTPCAEAKTVDYLVVAGGGAGGGPSGAPTQGGGGGAGGFRLSNSFCTPNMSPLSNPTGLTLTATTFPITVGAGGSGTGPFPGRNGNNSVFSTITSALGGTGGDNRPTSPTADRSAGPGGSGGGAAGANGIIGSGNTPPVSPPQGNNGGTGFDGTTINTNGGGGGGAAAVGANSGNGSGGDGGIGSFIGDTFIGPTAPSYGTPGPESNTRYFSGGGGGNTNAPGGPKGVGGAGGGGSQGETGTANTGGGGFSNNSGGKGIVMIRYKFQ